MNVMELNFSTVEAQFGMRTVTIINAETFCVIKKTYK